MKRAIFSTSTKGGVGKTLFSRGLLDRHRRGGIRCAAYDCDADVGQLAQYYGSRDKKGSLTIEQDPLAGVGMIDIQDPIEIIDAIDLGADVLLYDLPGGHMPDLGSLVGGNQGYKGLVSTFKEADYAVTIAIVITPYKKAILAVQDALDAFGDTVDYVVVENAFYGTPEDYLLWIESATRQRLIDAGGQVIRMPALQAGTLVLLDEHNLSFREGRDSIRLLKRGHCSRIHSFMHGLDEEINQVALLLGLGSPE